MLLDGPLQADEASSSAAARWPRLPTWGATAKLGRSAVRLAVFTSLVALPLDLAIAGLRLFSARPSDGLALALQDAFVSFEPDDLHSPLAFCAATTLVYADLR